MKRFKTSQIYYVFTMLILGVFLITGCGSGGGEVTEHWAPARTLTSILVMPVAWTVPVTGEKQFTATAVYSDGTSIDVTTVSTWTSINLVNASVGLHTGIATGKVVGTSTTIKADYGGLSGSGTLNVNAATSVSFVVTPKTASIPVTGTKQYTALEIFSDGSIQDRTSDPGTTWNSGTTSVATLDSLIRGRFTGVNPGTSTITAVYGVYTGTFGGTVGIANRTAILTVTDATSVSFVVTPKTASIPVTGTKQYTAIETFSDGTTQDRTSDSGTTWNSGTTSVATLDSLIRGRFTGVNPGTSTITAVYGVYTGTFGGTVGIANRTAVLTVTDAISVSFVVTPKVASVVVGGEQKYMAIETFSDGSTIDRTSATNPDITWSSDPTSVATVISNTGVATGHAIGTSTIKAEYGVYTGTFGGTIGIANRTAVLTVTAPTPGPGGDVDLGTASTYGIMAYSAMTLSAPAISHIYGDVGILFTSTFTGFDFDRAVPSAASPISIYVTGQTTSGPTATTGYNNLNFGAMVTAFNDLNAAWLANNKTNKPAPATPPSGALPAGGTFAASGQDLTGMLLGPGIYATPSTDTLGLSNGSGPLVLDGGGNPDAVFIFQATDLTTTSGSVVLRNGAQAKNVYWVLTQTATIGNGTLFQGTILAGAAVTVGQYTSVEGRALAGASLTSGILTINGGVITVP